MGCVFFNPNWCERTISGMLNKVERRLRICVCLYVECVGRKKLIIPLYVSLTVLFFCVYKKGNVCVFVFTDKKKEYY